MVSDVRIEHEVVDKKKNVVWVDLSIKFKVKNDWMRIDEQGAIEMMVEPADITMLVQAMTEYVNGLRKKYKKMVMYRWMKPKIEEKMYAID